MQETADTAPQFLVDLLDARSPTGAEYEAQAVVDRVIEPIADLYQRDTMGNRLATLNPEGDPSILFAGHIDELGLIITYINDKGFIYFDTLGGHDKSMISGRRVARTFGVLLRYLLTIRWASERTSSSRA